MKSLTTLVLACVGLTGYAQTLSEPRPRAAAEEDIREVVLRYQMLSWGSDGDKLERNAADATEKAIARRLNSPLYFVSVNGKDPTDDFLKRLQDMPRKIKKASEGTNQAVPRLGRRQKDQATWNYLQCE